MKQLLVTLPCLMLIAACGRQDTPANGYLDNTGRDDVLSGGARLIQIHTPKGDFNV